METNIEDLSKVKQNGGVTIQGQDGQQLGIINTEGSFTGEGLLIIRSAPEELIDQVGTDGVASAIVDITVVGNDGKEKQPNGLLELCLRIYNSTDADKKLCLSYIDESVNPPEWKCQDECLTQISPTFWCGKTNHLTNFAVLLTGRNDQNKRLKDCSDNGEYYIFGYWIYDAILALGIAGIVVLIAVVLILVVVLIKPIDEAVRGKSNTRVQKLRARRKNLRQSNDVVIEEEETQPVY